MNLLFVDSDTYRLNSLVSVCEGNTITTARSYQEAIDKYQPPYDIMCLGDDEQFSQSLYQFCRWLPFQPELHKPPDIIFHAHNIAECYNSVYLLRKKRYTVVMFPYNKSLLHFFTTFVRSTQTEHGYGPFV